jgi:hypothetical protein
MSLFLAAAAGFLSGKAERSKAKREEERQIREEERLLDRQQKLYQFQYDIQRRTQLDADAEELAKKVKALVRTAGIDEGTAINVVKFGAYDDVFNAAVQGKLNPVGVQAMFGNSEETAPPTPPDPATYRTDTEDAVPAEPRVAPSIFLPDEPEGRSASQIVQDQNTFDRLMTNTLAAILPSGTYEVRTTEAGTHIIGTNRAINVAKSAIVTEAFTAYTKLANDPAVGPIKALNIIQNFILNNGQEITDFTDYDQLVAKLYQPLREQSFNQDIMPRYYVPVQPPAGTTNENAGASPGNVPAGAWRDGVFNQ